MEETARNHTEAIKPVRIGIAGCGGITPTVLRGMAGLPEIDIHVVQDINIAAAERVTSDFGIPRHCADFSDLLAHDIEMVVLNTPNDCHMPQALEALAAGKHCLVQKPLARNVEEGERMVAAASETDRLLGVVMLERGDPIHRQMRAMVQAGCLGTITAVRAILAHMNHLRHPPPAEDWRRSPEKIGGGSFIQLAIHYLDLAQWVLDQEIIEVDALSTSPLRPDIFPEDETTCAVGRFPDGVVGMFLSSFACSADEIEFRGTGGMIRREDWGIRWQSEKPFMGELWEAGRAGEAHQLTMPELAPRIAELLPKYEPHRLFALAVRGLAPLQTPGEIGVRTLRVVEAARRSAVEKRRISVGGQ